MLTFDTHVQDKEAGECLRLCHMAEDGCVFLDIETTGFRPASSHLYMIGAAFCVSGREGIWKIRQWLGERPQEEAALLRVLSQFLRPYRSLIHFNGERFDLPYLEEKYEQYAIESPLKDLASTDIYREIRPLKKLLEAVSASQKAWEGFLGMTREDRYDGGQLIRVYRDYVKTGREELAGLLCTHNREDVQGMLALMRLYAYPAAFGRTDYPVLSAQRRMTSCDGESSCAFGHFEICYRLLRRVPVPLRLEWHPGQERAGADQVRLILEGEQGRLLIPAASGSMRYYFPDYRNYYYLPQEDMAVHKSVAAFVNREYRTRATKDTCYIKKEGEFLLQPPLPVPACEPVLRRSLQDPSLWYSPQEDPAEDLSRTGELLRLWLPFLWEHARRIH